VLRKNFRIFYNKISNHEIISLNDLYAISR